MKTLRILIIEDSEDDALLMINELRRGGYEPLHERVDTLRTFESALEKDRWDIILSDYQLPKFSGLTALIVLQEKRLDIPFILVSGKVGEDIAVEAMKAGASDYIMKNNLAKLVPAIERDLREVDGRIHRRLAEQRLLESEERYRLLFQNAPIGVFNYDTEMRITECNELFLTIIRSQRGSIIGLDMNALKDQNVIPALRKALSGAKGYYEGFYRATTSSAELWISLRTAPVLNEHNEIQGCVAIIEDITEHRNDRQKILDEMETTSQLLMIADASAHTTDMNQLADEVTHSVCSAIRSDICLAYLWDREAHIFRPVKSVGLTNEEIPLFRTQPLEPDNRLIKQAIKSGKPDVVDLNGKTHSVESYNVHPSPLLFDKLCPMEVAVVLPVVGKEHHYALLLGFYRKKPVIAERDRKVYTGIANQLMAAFEQARLYKESIDRTMELSHKVETIRVMNEIDKSILSTLETQEILQIATMMLSRILPCEKGLIALADKQRQGFTLAADFGINRLPDNKFVLFKDTSATEIMETGRPRYLPDLHVADSMPNFDKWLVDEGFNSNIWVPLRIKDEVVGVLCVGSIKPSAFSSDHIFTLENIASQIGVALENARLVSDLEELFFATVKSLSTAIDAKSTWTAGHSERVTRYALEIGREMGLPDNNLRNLELAGLLHDIGKIGTYEYILDKTDELTPEELALLKQHPGRGAAILEPIKQFREVIPAIKYHHEAFADKGYPEGLNGEEIPILARIIAVADTVDAMGADRPYRKGRSMDEIIAELKKCSGRQFDPRIVEACLKVIGR